MLSKHKMTGRTKGQIAMQYVVKYAFVGIVIAVIAVIMWSVFFKK